ncbi:hypothetical protein [Psychromonas sp. KJ10-2]|uniref:hypothetical protein n=1 Tax=Psychromonas sp. KJ10-2 TaxID=3391822 RepID=UPI0039B68AB6
MVSIGVVTNISKQTVALLENSCHSAHVVAVASYPSTTLIPNERSEMFVMFERVNERTSYKKRVSLLDK